MFVHRKGFERVQAYTGVPGGYRNPPGSQWALMGHSGKEEEAAKVGAPPDPEGASEDWGIAVVAEGIKVGDGATVAPKAMVTRNVKGGAAK